MAKQAEELVVSGLSVELFDETLARHTPVVSGVSFRLRAGEGIGITGESGSGKTTLSLALAGLLPRDARVSANEWHWTLTGRNEPSTPRRTDPSADLKHGRRGETLFTLFQEPRASLHPYRTIGWQLARCERRARAARPDTARPLRSAHDALRAAGLDPDLASSYPHELSSGMCQRVFLAMAATLRARLLICDEPFASVDAAAQDDLAQLVHDWMRSHGLMLVLVSHDLELLRRLTSQTVVLYRGQVAEIGPTSAVLGGDATATHPYSRLLRDIDEERRFFALRPPAAAGEARCMFSPRCQWADPTVCVRELPPLTDANGSPAPAAVPAERVHRMRCDRSSFLKKAGRVERAARAQGQEGRAATDRMREVASEHAAARETLDPTALRAPQQTAAGPRALVRATGVAAGYRTGWLGRHIRPVLHDISLSIAPLERVGIIGPSGQGKTTLARVLVGLLRPTAGIVEAARDRGWTDLSAMSERERRQFRRRVQMVYQDADLVLDPAARIADSLIEAYRVYDPRCSTRNAYALAARVMEELALDPSLLEAYPYRLSGGERKRLLIARSLAAFGYPCAAGPGKRGGVLILDEPTAGVDAVLQSIVARFLLRVQRPLRLSYVVISHEQSFVRRFCDRVLRLEHGRLIP